MGAKNKVIAGDYEKKQIDSTFGKPYILIGFNNLVYLNKETVECIDIITEDIRKSAASGVIRGAVGYGLLGAVGLLAGGLSAKNKGVHTIAVKFKDGKNSLLEVNDKLYKMIMKMTF